MQINPVFRNVLVVMQKQRGGLLGRVYKSYFTAEAEKHRGVNN
jgi:hypothetical protein